MSNMIQISRIPVKLAWSLPPETRAALIEAKNQLRTGFAARQFLNNRGQYEGDGSPLPKLDAGCLYREFDVGESRDPVPNRGTKRLVIEWHPSSQQVKNVYYTENHYLKFSFFRIV
jgi:guanyl-specific ribonuclease Sa